MLLLLIIVIIIHPIDSNFQVNEHNAWDKTEQPRQNSVIIFNPSQTVYCLDFRKEAIMVHFKYFKVFLSSWFNVIKFAVVYILHQY